MGGPHARRCGRRRARRRTCRGGRERAASSRSWRSRASQTHGGSPRALPVRPRACRWPGSRPHRARLPIPREPAGSPAAAPCPGRPECMQVEHSTQHELDTTLTRAPARLRGRPRRARRTRSGPRGSADRLQPGAPPSAPGATRRGGRVSAPHARDRNSTARRHGGQPGAGPVLDLNEPPRWVPLQRPLVDAGIGAVGTGCAAARQPNVSAVSRSVDCSLMAMPNMPRRGSGGTTRNSTRGAKRRRAILIPVPMARTARSLPSRLMTIGRGATG